MSENIVLEEQEEKKYQKLWTWFTVFLTIIGIVVLIALVLNISIGNAWWSAIFSPIFLIIGAIILIEIFNN